jgi:hypothetical protein
LLYALYTSDSEVLGKLVAKLHQSQDPRHNEAFVEYLQLLADHGLLRTDRPVADLAVAYRAILHGFLQDEVPEDREARADLLADTVAHAFQPAAAPPAAQVLAIAPQAIALFAETAELDRANVRRAY